MFFGKAPNCCDIDQIAGQVGGVGADDHPGIRSDQLLQLLCLYIPQTVGRLETHLYPLPFQMVQRPQHGIVLQIRSDHMIPRPKQTKQRNVQALGRI